MKVCRILKVLALLIFFQKNLKTDGVNSIGLKKHPVRNSTRRQHFARAPIRSLEIFHKYEEVFKKFDVDISRGINCKGCWETNRHTLQRQLIPETLGSFSDLPDASSSSYLDESVKNVLRKLKMSVLHTCDIDDLNFCEFNPDTYPGFRFSEYLMAVQKKDCVLDALKLAKERWEYI